MSIIIYGIRNCDTMKKAFAWLETHGVAYEFHDYKTAGVMTAELTRWCHAKGWETMLNRAGSSFRKLQDSDKQNLTQDKAIALMIGNPSMIKRPVLDMDGTIEIGFKPERYAALLGAVK
jgi:arsenate reductase (glutaredoxin)